MQIEIGRQQLKVIDNVVYFQIKEVLRERGYWFKFGIRDKIIDYCVKHAKHLEASFKEFPELKFNKNPIMWLNLGQKKKQVGLFPTDPMFFYWYFVNTAGVLVKKKHKEAAEQATLFKNGDLTFLDKGV